MVAHPVTQVIGEQALVDILDLSEVAWTYWGCFYTQQWAGAEDGEGITVDLQLALGMNERR